MRARNFRRGALGMGRTRGQSLVAVDGYGRMAAVGLHAGRVSLRGPVGRRSSLEPAFARPIQSMGGTGPRDGLSRSMSSVFVDPPPLKDVLGSSGAFPRRHE